MQTSIVHINKYSLLNQCILRQDSPHEKKDNNVKLRAKIFFTDQMRKAEREEAQ